MLLLVHAWSFGAAQAACLKRPERSGLSIQHQLESRLSLTPIKVSIATWDSHQILSQVLRIIAEDHFGYKVELYPTRSSKMGYEELLKGSCDVNIELWPTAAPKEFELFSEANAQVKFGRVVNAGVNGYTGRSGIYIRPASVDDSELIDQQWRWYGNFASVLENNLLSSNDLRQHSYCQKNLCEFNHTFPVCAQRDCPVFFAQGNPGDGDRLQIWKMFKRAGLPVTMVFVRETDTETRETPMSILQKPPMSNLQKPALYYSWFPSFDPKSTSNNMPLRLNFEPPSSEFCNDFFEHLTAGQNISCDFEMARIHKGMTKTFAQTFTSLGHVVANLNFSQSQLKVLLQQKAHGMTAEAIACEWLRDNEAAWKSWLPQQTHWSEAVNYLVNIGFLFMILLIAWWLFYPSCIYRKPFTPQWEPVYQGPSEYWYWKSAWPGFCHSWLVFPFFSHLKQASIALRDTHGALGAVSATQQALLRTWRLLEGKHDQITKVAPRVGPLTSKELLAAARIVRLLAAHKKRLAAYSGIELRVHKRLVEGLQFSQSTYYGEQADASSLVDVQIMRGTELNTERLKVKVRLVNGSAVGGVDAKLGPGADQFVMEAGTCCLSVPVMVLPNPHGLAMKSIWLPLRTFQLELSAETESGEEVFLGATRAAEVILINGTEWPCPNAASKGRWWLLFHFCLEVVKGNSKREFFWVLNISFRIFHSSLVDPLILETLINNVLRHDLDVGIPLALIKLVCILVEQYLAQSLSVEYPICWQKSWQWLFTKWASLPLLQATEQRHAFRLTCERIDMEFAGKSYKAVARTFEYVLNVSFIIVSTVWLVEPPQLYGILIMYVSVVVLFCITILVPVQYATAHNQSWRYHSKFLFMRNQMFDEPVLQRNYRTGSHDLDALTLAHRMRKVEQDKKWYMRHNRLDIVTWLTWLPSLVLFILAPMLENEHFSVGALVAILSNLRTLASTLLRLLTTQEEIICASCSVSEFANVLNTSTQDSLAAAHQCGIIGSHRKVQSKSMPPNAMHTITFSEVFIEESHGIFECSIHGDIATGILYGLQESRRHRALLEVVGGLQLPKSGALLFPPALKVLSGGMGANETSSDRTILDSLLCGLPHGHHVNEHLVWRICGALGMDTTVFNEFFRNVPIFKVLWVISPLDLQLISVVRALVCLPDVLLVHPLQNLTPRRAAMVRGVLTRFVLGCGLGSLGCLPASSFQQSPVPQPAVLDSSAPRTRRTVLWISDHTTLRFLRDLEVPAAELKVSSSGDIQVQAPGDESNWTGAVQL